MRFFYLIVVHVSESYILQSFYSLEINLHLGDLKLVQYSNFILSALTFLVKVYFNSPLLNLKL